MTNSSRVTSFASCSSPSLTLKSWDKPPTVSALADQGTKRRNIVDLEGRDPGEFNRALHFVGDLERAVKLLGDLEVDRVIPTLTVKERAKVRAAISQIDARADQIIARLS